MFETIIDIVSGEPKMLFVDLSYAIKTEEAERIGLDHVAKLSATPQVCFHHINIFHLLSEWQPNYLFFIFQPLTGF